MIMKVGRIKKTLKKVSRKRGVVFFVDGKTADVQKIMDKITYIKEILEEIGGILSIKFFLEGSVSDTMITRITESGCLPVIVPGDVDIYLALEATEQIFNNKVTTVALATTNTDLLLVLIRTREEGKKTVLIKNGDETTPLENVVDLTLNLDVLE
ncbi:MAG: NYN domain-containing protein [Candidatus Asgardarchaeia archaeon]